MQSINHTRKHETPPPTYVRLAELSFTHISPRCGPESVDNAIASYHEEVVRSVKYKYRYAEYQYEVDGDAVNGDAVDGDAVNGDAVDGDEGGHVF